MKYILSEGLAIEMAADGSFDLEVELDWDDVNFTISNAEALALSEYLKSKLEVGMEVYP